MLSATMNFIEHKERDVARVTQITRIQGDAINGVTRDSFKGGIVVSAHNHHPWFLLGLLKLVPSIRNRVPVHCCQYNLKHRLPFLLLALSLPLLLLLLPFNSTTQQLHQSRARQ
jgi:hypothetical protein